MIQYELIPDAKGVGFERNGITWLASWPKSGNTWVRMFLSAYLNGPENFSLKVRNFSGDSQMYCYQAVSPIPMSMLTDLEVWRLRDAALSHMFFSSVKTNLILKTHTANACLNDRWLIPKDLTHKSIYIVRDPRDVMVSWRRYAGASWKDAFDTLTNEEGRVYSKHPMAIPSFVSSWQRHVESWINDGKLSPAVIKYEGLLKDPETGFTNLLDYLEIEVDSARVKECVDLVSLDSLRENEKENGFFENMSKTTFFHKGGSRWEHELPPEYAREIEDQCGELMKQFDYL